MKQTRINKLFDIKLPIIQAGMVWTSGWSLASAASENGCLGLIGAGSMKPELLSEHITKLKNYFQEKKISKSFGVNLPLIRGDINELIKTILKEEVKVVFSSAGNPKAFTNIFKENNITWVHVVASVKHALKAQDAGCDAVVAEGFEAGGHNGIDEITTLCLVPQVAAALEIPVIAAGGIATGAQIAACMAIGAEGVQIGTRFAASVEASSSEIYKNKIVEAKDSDTYLIMKKLNPVRLFKNKFAEDVIRAERSGASEDELKEMLGRKREMKGIFEGDLDEGELEMGQSSGLVNEILPVEAIVQNLLKEYDEAVLKL
jgi:enoyl-[acyl-carrier protein] reductase II